VLDEWAFLENPEDAWASIKPVIDIGGRIIGLSTANGVGNIFYTLWERAVSGHSNFHYLFYPWNVVPERDDAWYERQKLDFLEWQLHQEFPATPEEAFIKSGNMVFSAEVLDKIQPRAGQIGQLVRVAPDGLRFDTDMTRGPLTVWERPDLTHDYVMGADVAEGLEHGDYSSAHVLDLHTGEVVAHWHGHVDPDEFAAVLADLGRWYFQALIGCESNNHGLTTLVALRNLRYPRIYVETDYSKTVRKRTERLGWRTTVTTKPLMIDELALALRREEVDLACGDTLGELRTYVRDERGRMGGSPFDDRVGSLAICNQMRKHAVAFPKKIERPTEWSVDWWADLATAKDEEVLPVGAYNTRSAW